MKIYLIVSESNHGGTLINPIKIQNINKNQGLFTIELDDTMKGINPVTGKTTTLTKIMGLHYIIMEINQSTLIQVILLH